MVTQGKMLPARQHVTSEPAERVVAQEHARSPLSSLPTEEGRAAAT